MICALLICISSSIAGKIKVLSVFWLFLINLHVKIFVASFSAVLICAMKFFSVCFFESLL